MTVVIDNLEKMALVERTPDPKDRRATVVKITAEGENLFADLFPRHIKNLSKILKTLDKEEKNQLINLTKKLGKGVS